MRTDFKLCGWPVFNVWQPIIRDKLAPIFIKLNRRRRQKLNALIDASFMGSELSAISDLNFYVVFVSTNFLNVTVLFLHSWKHNLYILFAIS